MTTPRAATAGPGRGPLAGFRVLEFEGVGPTPFAGMLLADMGAAVLRVDRPSATEMAVDLPHVVVNRGKEHVALDLKSASGKDVALGLVDQADAVLEGYRPGVMERLGLGPDVCLGRRPGLVYARMTGWGQTGALARSAGHDINYLAVSGVLHGIGRRDQPPTPPLNLVADYGGGAVLVAFGIVCGLLSARLTGRGDVIDAAMVDGSALLIGPVLEQMSRGDWTDERGANILDGGAPYYDAYPTADGKHIAVGATELPGFRALLLALGLDQFVDVDHTDRGTWQRTKRTMAARFAERTRDEWVDLLERLDLCVSPVLTMGEAAAHPHNVERGVYRAADGIRQPAQAPRFASARPALPRPLRPFDAASSAWVLPDPT